MNKIWKNDFYRFTKSPVLLFTTAFAFLLPFALTMILRQNINFGVGVGTFGEPTIVAFREMRDIIHMGVQYHMGLGIFVAVLISVFIGQEYQWNTWQHKWIIGKSRTNIYISKVFVSCVSSAVLFLLFQSVVLLFSGQMMEILSSEYAALIINGVFIYIALGAVICMLSMLIRNHIASVVTSLIFVMFSESLTSLIGIISGASSLTAPIGSWIIRHTVYGMSLRASEAYSLNLMAGMGVNSLIIIALYTCFGLFVFRKYEL